MDSTEKKTNTKLNHTEIQPLYSTTTTTEQPGDQSKAQELHQYHQQCSGHVTSINIDQFNIPDHWRISQSIQSAQDLDLTEDLNRFTSEGGAINSNNS